MKAKFLTRVCAITALISIFSPIAIPVGPLNITLAFWIMLLVSLLFEWLESLVATFIYYTLIIIGFPIGTNLLGGIWFFINPWAGYYIGYLFIPPIIHYSKGFLRGKGVIWGSFLALFIVYFWGLIGVWIWSYASGLNSNLIHIISIAVGPFIIVDFIKIITALFIYNVIKKRMITI